MPTGVRYPELQDKSWLVAKYVDVPMSVSAIAAHLGCSNVAVYTALKRHDVPMRSRTVGRRVAEHHRPRQCVRCGVNYTPTSGSQRFCTQECRDSGPAIVVRPRTAAYPELQDRDWLQAQYNKPRSGASIAEQVGCDTQLVYYWLAKHEIPRRSNTTRTSVYEPKPCRRCETMFQPNAPSQLFCSGRCKRQKPYTCVECGEQFWSRVSGLRKVETYWGNPVCSIECRDEAKRKWLTQRRSAHLDNSLIAGELPREGDAPIRRTNDAGYVRIMVSPDYPGAYKHGWVPEHRYVMEQSIGRHLYADETVHHINGDRADNRIENLQLRRGRHGNGAAFRCNSCGSHDVIAVELAEP